jgi:hypothetical protein
MAINSPNGPQDAGIAIGGRLDELLSRGPEARVPQAGADKGAAALPQGSLQMSQPLPLYTVDLSAIQDEGFIAHARQVGWRYMIFGQGSNLVALADIDDTGQAGKSQFKRLTRGPIAQKLLDAIGVAENTFAASPSAYEIRVLEILELYVVAVWIANSSNSFIPVAEGTAANPAKIYVDPSFPSRIVKLAQLRGQRGAPMGAVP